MKILIEGGGTLGPGAAERVPPKALIDCLVAALSADGTVTARKALAKIVDGTLPNDDDKHATEAALRALLDQPDAEI